MVCAWLLTTVLIVCLTGCVRNTRDDDAGFSSASAVKRTSQDGPVTLSLIASTDDLALTDHSQLRLEIVADSGVIVSDIEYEQALAEGDRAFEFRAQPVRQELAKPTDNGKLRWTIDYAIEFFLPGEYELPPAEASFVVPTEEERPAGEATPSPAEPRVISTEPIKIVVRAPPDAAMSPEQWGRIQRLDPVELAEKPGPWPWITSVAVVGALAIAIWLLRRSKRRRAEAILHIPAHEWARREMGALVAENLIGRGLVQEFYYRISGVVRGYIERRFDVSAPEMTTEEFLATAGEDRRFEPATTMELNRFLSACDLVKYARHEPGTIASQGVLEAAGDFVERTRERDPQGETDDTSTPSAEEQAA